MEVVCLGIERGNAIRICERITLHKYIFCNDESAVDADNLSIMEVVCLGIYQGVTGRVEYQKESDDCWTCFFTVPKEDDDVNVYEVSLYNMGKDGFVLSLEPDASDNRLSEESDQLAEELAIELDADSIDHNPPLLLYDLDHRPS